MSELPKGWGISTVGDVADLIRGVTYAKSDATDRETEGFVPLLRATNIDEGRLALSDFVFVSRDKVKQAQYVQQGDLVLAASSGSIRVVGKSAVVPSGFSGTFGAFCMALRPNSGINHQYLQHYISSPEVRKTWSSLARGTNINNLKRDQIVTTEVPLPPLPEQQRIVEILEEQFSRLDAASASIRAVREKAEQFRRSLLHAAFDHSLAGTASKDWKVKNLGDVATLSLGKMLDKKQHTGLNQTPYMRNINVRWGNVVLDDLQVMDIAPEQLDRVSLRSGDVVVCEGGEPGRASVWAGDETIAIQKALHRVRPCEGLNSTFLYYLFEREFRGVRNHRLFTGTTIKHLPKEKISTMGVPLPSLPEQEEIVEILDQQFSRLDAVLAATDTLEHGIKNMRRSILHSAFSGNLTSEWRRSNV